ncbi:MAG: hypothetical protein IKT55_03045 [Clostridia bacterium]|nr:hypothetical protein [Clostridia bacterium]
MKVKVTKDTVIITEYTPVNAGERGVNLCELQLPEEFKSLTVTAAFNNIPVPVKEGECIIPTLPKGTVVLGVYAYKESVQGVELMYSPKPTAFYVNEGSYTDEVAVEENPTVGEYEKYCHQFGTALLEKVEGHEKALNKISAITESSTHDQYPSAKAVYDLVEAEKGPDITIVDTVAVDEEHTNQQVYGALAMDEALNAFSEALEQAGESKPKVFERISTVVVEADEDGNLPTTISITKDGNGKPFELTDFYCDVLIGLTDGANGKLYIQAGGTMMIGALNAYFLNTLRKWNCRYDNYGEGNGGLFVAPNGTIASTTNFPNNNITNLVGQPVPVGQTVNINSLKFVITTGTAKTFVEGTTITLWGVRK